MTTNPDKAPRLYLEASLASLKTISLPKEQSHYLSNVLRKQQGDFVRLFNALEGEWLASVSAVGKKAVDLHIKENINPPRPVRPLTLLCAPIKRAYFDYVIMKATELGVATIQPILTSRTQIRDVNQERCRAIAIEAAEQSERIDIPDCRAAIAFDQMLNTWPANAIPLICAEFGDALSIEPALAALQLNVNTNPSIIVGPEGGFTPEEMDAVRRLPGAMALCLGPRILRADTAAIAAITCWQAIRGDWREPRTNGKLKHV